MSALELPSIEECKAYLHGEIVKEQLRFHEAVERLKTHQREARSDEAVDRIRGRIRETWDNHCRAIEPIRRQLDSINMALARIEMLKPMPPLVITG